MALSLHQAAQYQKALPIFIDLSEKFRVKRNISDYALCQLKIADIIRNYGGVNTAIELLTTNEKVMEVGLERPTLTLAYNYIAKAEALYTALRLTEFKEAILRSISIKKQMLLPEKYLAEDYLHLARYYKELPNQNDSCYYWLLKSLRLAKSDKSFSIYILPRIYNLLGYYYHPASNAYFNNKRDSLMRHYALSRRYYDSAMTVFKKQPLPDQLMEGKIYHNLGNSYSNEAGVDNKIELIHYAISYYRRSLNAIEKLGSPSDLTQKDWVIGRAYERLKLYDSAILQFQKGISRLIPEFEKQDFRLPPPLQPTLNDARLISLVTNKANNFYNKYKAHKDVSDLLSAFLHYEFLLKFNHYLLSQSQHEQETTHWNYLYGSNAYQRLVISAYELLDKNEDMSYLIKSYGLLTSGKYAWLNRNDIEPVLGNSISSSVLKEEIKLVKLNIIKSIPDLTEAKINSILPVIPMNVTAPSLAQIHLADQILDTLSVKGLQRELRKENEVLIDFYVWNQDLYSIIISGRDFKVMKQRIPKNFGSTIWEQKRNLLTSTPNEYARISNTIYLETLDSVLRVVPKESSGLIICPDASLQGIPWDALVTDTVNAKSFKGLNYLLNRFAIRTVLSPRHLIAKNRKAGAFLGVAPDFSNSKKFSSIPFSTALVKTKASEYGGKFSNVLPVDTLNVNVFHIASHVVNDSLRPYRSALYFNDTDSVTISELSTSMIHPTLAILNGCQTGNGTYYQSEGTISFARAFYRMGAESVLMTLWSVDDKTTADLLDSFYKEMEDESPLDISLREAKVDFIRNAPTDELANPYYWAGLQLSGKADPIHETDHSWIILTGISCIAIFFFATYSLKRKKSKRLVERV
ncbi:MAG: CHAT domain-containing protein [Cyclobacteriaceae bacterium]|nr:CHAT domain-containing protein [Cyclobacteriaceae bacterium]